MFILISQLADTFTCLMVVGVEESSQHNTWTHNNDPGASGITERILAENSSMYVIEM